MAKSAQQLQRRLPRPLKWWHVCRPSSSWSWSWTRSWSSLAWLLALIYICLLTRPVLPEVIYRVDPLALLAATLRTYQRAGCDSEQLSLSCPRGTSISIELAQYGRAGDLTDHSLCPPVSQEDLTTASGSAGDAVIHSGTEIEVKPPETCTVSGLQYALLQTVVDACQKKRHCKFAANSKTHSSGDPCSGIRKFVEIAYKCRPYEFRSKVACENDNMPLVCNPYSRIAIYSASFGHTERESVQCPGGQGVAGGASSSTGEDSSKPTCLVSYATETVMQICHGRRRCSVTADAGTFGRPCKTDVRMYLKVVYTCIPRKVLKDRYETAPEGDEPQQTELDLDQDELYDEDQFYKESEAIPPAPKLQGAIPNAGLPFDFGPGLGGDSETSTLLPPLLSRNDGSLEARLQASMRLLSRLRASLNQEEPAEISSTPAEEPAVSTTARDNDEEKQPESSTAESSMPVLSSASAGGNFFYRRKCQLVDDWGPIGLNCTEADVATERVEVVGFLVNWLHSYLHIRKHQEQFYLYLIISVVAGVLLCLTLVIGRLTLQKRRGARKNSSSSGSGAGKGFGDGAGGGAGGGGAGASSKFQQTATGETHLPDSFGDDISDIDADVDLTSPMPMPMSMPMPLPSLSSRNETYMTYAPTPNCTYGGLPGGHPHQHPHPHSHGHPASTNTTTVLMAPSQVSHHGGLMLSGPGKPLLVSSARQQTPPPATIYTSMGHPVVSGSLTMAPHMLGASGLSTMSPSYLSGTMMMGPSMGPGPGGHHHAHQGTLRRTLIPTSMGMMSTPSPPPPTVGMPSSSGVYYDSTVPRSLARGISADSNSAAQYFYG